VKKLSEQEAEKVYAYTPGLKVTESLTIQKTRLLPLPGEVMVKKGDKVEFDTIVARAFAPGEPELLNAAPILGVSKERLPEYTLKQVGDELKEGDIIAQNIFLFGLFKRYVYAPYDCTIESISQYSGRIIVRGANIPIEVSAYIPGEVIEVIPDQGVVVETEASFIQGIFGVGGESFGEIKFIVDSPDSVVTEEMISEEHKGKIIIGGSYITVEAIRKAVEVGAIGVVTGGINSKDLKDFLGYEIGVAITGEEPIGITLIATESFGIMNMATHTFNLLKKLEGQIASINGATQIRAGVLRPEILVPHQTQIDVDETEQELEEGMTIGTRIRVIRAPYFGKLGKVARLPAGLQKLETESMARVLDVEFDDGVQGTVPRANVEIIVEQ
jgi:hypothetical protein